MAVTPAYPSQYNTWVPSFADSNRLLVDFSRNPRDFSLNKYVQIVPVKKSMGYYLKMTLEERMRILDTNLANFAWPDGQDAPLGFNGTESFGFYLFQCKRFAYPFTLGDMAVEQAEWDISTQHLDIKAQQAMTARTQIAITMFTTSGSYATNHWRDLTAIKWSAATSANLNIRASLDTAIARILQDTGSVVRRGDLMLVVNPNAAKAMAESQEMVDYLKGSPDALRYIKGDTGEGPQADVMFGLPRTYAGLPIVVEDAVKVTTKKGTNTQTSAFVLADTTAFICARPGGMEGKYGGPSFSTGTAFLYKSDDMSVETKHDTENRKLNGRIVDTFAMVLTAPVSGYLFLNVT